MRRAAVLISELPEDSRIVALGAGFLGPWSVEREALATIADLLYALLRVNVAAYGQKGAADRLPRFEFPRPIAKPKKKPAAPAGELRGFGLLDELERRGAMTNG